MATPTPTPVTPCTLGHLYAGATGELTEQPLYLHPDQHFHTLVTGAVGTGKTVAAQRLVYETSRHWHLRSVVFDRLAEWRHLARVPGLAERMQVRRLGGGEDDCALRWNPLQVSRDIAPETYWRALSGACAAAWGLGPSRQEAGLRELLYGLYIRHGVLVEDNLVQRCQPQPVPLQVRDPGQVVPAASAVPALLYSNADDRWYEVRNAAERDLSGHAVGTPLQDLHVEVRALLGRLRSRAVGFTALLRAVRQQQETQPGPEAVYLEGVAQRVAALAEGRVGAALRSGPAVPDICDMVPPAGGICVVEYPPALDGVSTSFLTIWAAWQLCQVSIQTLRAAPPGRAKAGAALQIVFEGSDSLFRGDHDLLSSLWRDSRKYGIQLHCITSRPSRLPASITAVSANALISRLSESEDVAFMQQRLRDQGVDPADPGPGLDTGSADPWDAVLWTTPQAAACRMRPWMLECPDGAA